MHIKHNNKEKKNKQTRNKNMSKEKKEEKRKTLTFKYTDKRVFKLYTNTQNVVFVFVIKYFIFDYVDTFSN